MTEGKAGFPRTQNGYSPQHVDDFIVALAQRTKTQISTLEQRVADVQANAAASSCVELEEQIAKLERGIVDRDAQLVPGVDRRTVCQGGTGPPPQAAERLHARGLTGVWPDPQIAHGSSMRRR